MLQPLPGLQGRAVPIACQMGKASINSSIHFWFYLTTLSSSISSLLLLKKKK